MDSALAFLVLLARFHQIAAEPAQLQHEFGIPDGRCGDTELLRAAKALTFKAKQLRPSSFNKLENTLLPAIAKTRDGHYIILARIARDCDKASVLIQDPRQQSPQSLALADFEALRSGDLILLTRRTNLRESLQQTFDISWFIPSIVKYRKLLGEVVVASFFLQLFALITPLFFQVVTFTSATGNERAPFTIESRPAPAKNAES